jgi:hypothetical protein
MARSIKVSSLIIDLLPLYEINFAASLPLAKPHPLS